MTRASILILSLPIVSSVLFGCVGPGNVSPIAVISASPSLGRPPLTVSLSAEGSSDSDGRIARYDWSLGDGASASLISFQHTYRELGSYRVSLEVTDNNGATDSASVLIRVVSELPCLRGSMDNGELQLAILSTRAAGQIGENWFPEAGMRFVILDVEMEALVDGQRTLITSFTVHEEDGAVRELSPVTFVLDAFPSQDLQRGGKVSGKVAFEVSQQARELELHYDPILSSEMTLCFRVP